MLETLAHAIRHPLQVLRLYARLVRSDRLRGSCIFCGVERTLFRLGPSNRDGFYCRYCHSTLRQRHLAKVLIERLGDGCGYSCFRDFVGQMQGLVTYVAQSTGPLVSALARLEGARFSEFFHDVPLGGSWNGIRCEDLQALSFADASLDLVISQDVLEHVREPKRAFGEIWRTLKPGGLHIFSVPCDLAKKTVTRVAVVDGVEVFHHPPVYHEDTIRGGLVYTDFGSDLLDNLVAQGLPTEIHWFRENELQKFSYIFISTKSNLV